tara:strand:- start:845 stop:1420 length:576 start_codon:yes stop_codon:yes gene_type:complete
MSECQRSKKAAKNLTLALGAKGDIIECGVFQGQTTIALAKVLKSFDSPKKIYACDTYDGLPYDGREGIDDMLKKGECSSPFKEFWTNVCNAGVQDYIIPIPGLVEETLLSKLSEKKFCFAFLDMDLYEPTSYVYKFLKNRISIGGVIGYHDYKFERCPGIETVVDKEMDRDMYRMFDDHTANCAWLQKVKK